MKKESLLELLRIALGFIFLWAFLDKLFGLSFATAPDKSWLSGSSPTLGFLKFGTHGPFAEVFKNMAGNVFVDWLFMLGLLGVGLALILGMGMKIASYSGTLMMFFIYLSRIPPENNPLLDEHIIYILVLQILRENSGFKWGLRNRWKKTSIVKKYKFLE